MTSKHKPMLDAIEHEIANIGSRTMSEIAAVWRDWHAAREAAFLARRAA